MSARLAWRDTLHVSASQVKTYLLCPERFRQQYVTAQVPSHRSGDMVLGAAVHEVLANYHLRLLQDGGLPTIESLVTMLDYELSEAEAKPVPILWEDDDGAAKARAVGKALLETYYQSARVHRVLAVEKPFVLSVVDPRTGRPCEEQITGVVDLIEEDEDGRVYISELKTAGRRFDDARLAYDHQVSIYAAARSVLGFPTASMRFRVLLKTKKPALETIEVVRDEMQVAETQHVVRQVLRAVDAGIFYPARGWQCGGCPYRSTCGT